MAQDLGASRSHTGSSVADAAYLVLKKEGKPLHYSLIIREIIATQGRSDSARDRARVYTEMILDHRLTHLGGGEWGLKEWAPRPSGRTPVVRPAAARPKRDNRLRLEESEDAEVEFSVEPSEDEEDIEEDEETWDSLESED